MRRRAPWTRQPPTGTPIDWGNPLTRGIANAWSLGYDAAASQIDNQAPIVTTPYGLGADLSGSAVVSLGSALGAGSAVTLAVLAYNISGTPASVFTTANVGIYYGAGGSSWWLSANGSTLVAVNSIASPTSAAAIFSMDAVSGAATGLLAPLVNNSPIPGVASGATPTAYASSPLTLNSGGSGINGAVAQAIAWRRSLSATEQSSWIRNPWQLWLPPRRRVYSLPSSSTTGTASIIELPDGLSLSGTVQVAGSAALYEGPDYSTDTSTVATAGSAAITESTDTPAISGSTGSGGSVVVTEGADTVSASGSASVSGAVSVLEAGDYSDNTAVVSLSGSGQPIESYDIVSASGNTGIAGSIAVVEAGDIIVVSGSVSASGTVSIAEGLDSSSALASVYTSGVADIAEAADMSSLYGIVGNLILGSVQLTEGNDYSANPFVGTPIDAAQTALNVLQALDFMSVAQAQDSISVVQAQDRVVIMQ